MMNSGHRLAAVATAILCMGPSAARGEGGPEVFVRADEAGCPSPALMRADLSRVLHRHTIVVVPSTSAAIAVTVGDRGDLYRVTIGEQTASYHDEGQPCGERARRAAVFAALVLEPPYPDAPSPPPPSPPRPPPTPARGHVTHVDLEFAGTLAYAPGDPIGAGGGGLRLAVGTPWPWFWGTVGAGALYHWPVEESLVSDGAHHPLHRRFILLPVDVSLRAVLNRGRFEGFAELGLLVRTVIDEGVDVGLRGAAGFRARVTDRLALFIALEADVSQGSWNAHLFDDPILAVNGTNSTVNNTIIPPLAPVYFASPSLWLSCTAGLSVRLR